MATSSESMQQLDEMASKVAALHDLIQQKQKQIKACKQLADWQAAHSSESSDPCNVESLTPEVGKDCVKYQQELKQEAELHADECAQLLAKTKDQLQSLQSQASELIATDVKGGLQAVRDQLLQSVSDETEKVAAFADNDRLKKIDDILTESDKSKSEQEKEEAYKRQRAKTVGERFEKCAQEVPRFLQQNERPCHLEKVYSVQDSAAKAREWARKATDGRSKGKEELEALRTRRAQLDEKQQACDRRRKEAMACLQKKHARVEELGEETTQALREYLDAVVVNEALYKVDDAVSQEKVSVDVQLEAASVEREEADLAGALCAAKASEAADAIDADVQEKAVEVLKKAEVPVQCAMENTVIARELLRRLAAEKSAEIKKRSKELQQSEKELGELNQLCRQKPSEANQFQKARKCGLVEQLTEDLKKAEAELRNVQEMLATAEKQFASFMIMPCEFNETALTELADGLVGAAYGRFECFPSLDDSEAAETCSADQVALQLVPPNFEEMLQKALDDKLQIEMEHQELAKQEIMEKNHELFTQNQELRQRMDRMDFLLSKVLLERQGNVHPRDLEGGSTASWEEVERLTQEAEQAEQAEEAKEAKEAEEAVEGA